MIEDMHGSLIKRTRNPGAVIIGSLSSQAAMQVDMIDNNLEQHEVAID